MNSTWQIRHHSPSVIYVYKVNSLTPSFKFTTETSDWPFAGHGKTFHTKSQMQQYIELHGNQMIKKGQCL